MGAALETGVEAGFLSLNHSFVYHFVHAILRKSATTRRQQETFFHQQQEKGQSFAYHLIEQSFHSPCTIGGGPWFGVGKTTVTSSFRRYDSAGLFSFVMLSLLSLPFLVLFVSLFWGGGGWRGLDTRG